MEELIVNAKKSENITVVGFFIKIISRAVR